MTEVVKTHTPPEGVEERRKVDPQRTVLPLEAHGARALNRFVGPDASDFDATAAKDFTEGDDMRNVMEGFFEQREFRGPINIGRFVGKYFEAAKALNTVKEGDKPFPSVEDAIKHFADLSPEELADINQMQKPVFQLLPITSSERNLEDLNGNKPIDRQIDANVSPWTEGALERADVRDGVGEGEAIVGWNIAITEGVNAPDVLEGDDVSEKIEDRLAWFKTTHGDRGCDLKRYMKLQQAGFAKEDPRPLDDLFGQDDTWTMLNGDPVHDNCVAGGNWYDGVRQVDLGERDVGGQGVRGRFRLSVMRRCA
ncbi:MAG: hypothetical protein AAB540_03735 [Patescibacteria group bacterium]